LSFYAGMRAMTRLMRGYKALKNLNIERFGTNLIASPPNTLLLSKSPCGSLP
jgi:hypothetical protein